MHVPRFAESPDVTAAADSPAASASNALDRLALRLIQRQLAAAPIRFVLWDGFAGAPATAPVAAVTFRTRAALLGCVWDPQLYFGEAYMSGALQVRGDLVALLEAIYHAVGPRTRPSWLPRHRGNPPRVSRRNVHHHYDIGNDFYRLWLDEQLVYTCAYFPTPGTALDAAQVAKMDLVCRKLRLSPGERVIETGCGWGSLALFMAKRYGVTVRAYNISSEQMAWARRRAAAEGLADRVAFVEDDYRAATGPCDAFVSIGMLEHVGLTHYAALGEVIDRTLTRNGRGLLHFIGRDQPGQLNPWILRRIFPGAYAPTLREVFARVLEPHRLSVLDVENLRLHYAKTLEHWRARYTAAAGRVLAMFDAPFVRAWDLYLAGSQVAFTTGSLQLFQVVFARGGSNELPWTRGSALGAAEPRAPSPQPRS